MRSAASHGIDITFHKGGLIDFAAAFGLARSRAGVWAEIAAAADDIAAAARPAAAAANDIAAIRLSLVPSGFLILSLAPIISVLLF